MSNNNEHWKENLQSARESVKGNLQAARADVLAARKCENINDPVDTHVIDYVAMVFSRLFIKLHIIPNVVTLLSMVSGVSGGVLLALNRGLALDCLGAVLVFLSAVFDASDGQVARLTKHYSQIGRMLDGLSDSLVYVSLYAAGVARLWDRVPQENPGLWHGLLIALAVLTYAAYVAQCQLPDYYKNLHMYMIDNSHGNELARTRHIRAAMQAAETGFQRFAQFCYLTYTAAQERRAPQAQRLLDAVEEKGKNDALCDAFYARSRKLVMRTNLLTFNLRTAVLLACYLLHWELVSFCFVLLVLEPIRVVLLRKYEALCRDLLPLVK